MVEKKQLKGEIYLFSMKSQNVEVNVTNYGASIFSIVMPDRHGVRDEITLTCDNIEDFEKNRIFMGAMIGRVANRIPYGKFTLDGKRYTLEMNDGNNHLHGGKQGFDKKIWGCRIDGDRVIFTYVSCDGEEGYPGNLTVDVSYSLKDDALLLEYTAQSDQMTIVNLTNHVYLNMGGHKSGSVLGHTLKVNGRFYVETNAELQPTGQILSVKGTPLDFTQQHTIGERIGEFHGMLKNAGGYDLSYVRDISDDFAAEYTDPGSGRRVTVSTSLPCVHFYTGNFVNNEKGINGAVYQKQQSVCLETQFLPDAVNHWYFGPTVLRAGEKMRQYTRYAFGIK